MSDDFILLVEDNPMDEALTLRALKKNAITNPIAIARDGTEALDYLLARGAHIGVAAPRLVLLDLKLPKLDGLEVLREARAHDRTRGVPIIVLTSSREETDIRRAYTYGANSYFRKPVDFAEFVTAVGHLGRYWLELNERPPNA